jgi:potassium efflux system protein
MSMRADNTATRAIRLALSLILALLLAGAGSAAGAVEMPADASISLTPAMVNAQIEDILKADGLDDATKTRLLDHYRNALANLEKAAGFDAQTGQFAELFKTAPEEISGIRDGLGRQAETGPQDLEAQADSLPLKEAEQQLLKDRAEAAFAEDVAGSLNEQLNQQVGRSAVIKERLAAIKDAESELHAGRGAPVVSSDPLSAAKASDWLWQSRVHVLRSEARMLGQELQTLPLMRELTNARRQEAEVSLQEARMRVRILETITGRKRQEEAAASVVQATEAVRQAEDGSSLLRQVAADNAKLSHDLQELTSALESLEAKKNTIDQELEKVEESFRLIRRKIELAGASQSLGFLLHEQRRTLVSAKSLGDMMTDGEDAVAKAGLERMQHEEEWARLKDIDGYMARLVSESSQEEPVSEPELRTLLEARRKLLEKIIHFDQLRFTRLSELEIAYHEYLSTLESHNRFLDERLLWVRSTPFMGLKDFAHLPAEIAALAAPGQWALSFALLFGHAQSWPLLILSCVAVAALRQRRKRVTSLLESSVAQADNPDTYHFALPLRAFGLTVLLALQWPLLLFVLGWEMHGLPMTTPFAQSMGAGLMIISWDYACMGILLGMLAPNGLADGFFHWPQGTIALLRRETARLMAFMLPLVLVGRLATYGSLQAGGNAGFGRLVLITALGFLSFFLYRVLHPETGVWKRALNKYSRRLWARFYPVFFPLVVSFPVIMGCLVVVGYVFTVGTLVRCFFYSLWVVLGLVFCHQVAARWLVQSVRRAASETEQDAAPSPQGKTADRAPGPPEPDQDPDADEAELPGSRIFLNVTTAVALVFGLWLVWEDVFPALRVLNQFNLWSYASVVDGQPATVQVTLGSLGLAAIIGVMTWAATLHLPGLIRMFLSSQFGISAGGVYTVTTLAGYAISVIGTLVVVSILGFKWSQIQWLVAALGVGIGFGLQEIVANFISGLIILFERPIRVGDIVTVGNTDGVVTRIRIRATTIRDFDRKELLVPNKEFISGQLLNWSLSDPVIRIIVPVGVAYGSDVQRAMELMMRAARESKYVLKKPKPMVTFESFEDNSLLLKLRCFIGSVDDRLSAISDLHVSIDRKFREADISIAFPQRDVHIDTTRPLEIKVSREKKQADGAQETAGSGV